MKKYIQPSITIHEMQPQCLMAESETLGLNGGEGQGNNDATNAYRGNSNHSGWGNLWGVED